MSIKKHYRLFGYQPKDTINPETSAPPNRGSSVCKSAKAMCNSEASKDRFVNACVPLSSTVKQSQGIQMIYKISAIGSIQIDVYDIKYDAYGKPMFLIYYDGSWKLEPGDKFVPLNLED